MHGAAMARGVTVFLVFLEGIFGVKRFLAVAALLAVSNSAHATECKGLLSIIGIDTGFSCEQRAAMTGTGAAMMQSAQPPAPAPFSFSRHQRRRLRPFSLCQRTALLRSGSYRRASLRRERHACPCRSISFARMTARSSAVLTKILAKLDLKVGQLVVFPCVFGRKLGVVDQSGEECGRDFNAPSDSHPARRVQVGFLKARGIIHDFDDGFILLVGEALPE